MKKTVVTMDGKLAIQFEITSPINLNSKNIKSRPGDTFTTSYNLLVDEVHTIAKQMCPTCPFREHDLQSGDMKVEGIKDLSAIQKVWKCHEDPKVRCRGSHNAFEKEMKR